MGEDGDTIQGQSGKATSLLDIETAPVHTSVEIVIATS